jgi:hypothetical protein
LNRIKKGFVGDDPQWIITRSEFQDAMEEHSTPRRITFKTDYLINILLDQKLVCSGLGNYLTCEILHRMKISPWARVAEVWNTPTVRNNLFDVCKSVVQEAYEKHGARGYQDLFGVAGNFEPEIYNRSTCLSNPDQCIKCEPGPHGRNVFYTKDQLVLVPDSTKRKITDFFQMADKKPKAAEVLGSKAECVDPIQFAMQNTDCRFWTQPFANRSLFESAISVIMSQRVQFSTSSKWRKWLYEKVGTRQLTYRHIEQIYTQDWKQNTCLTDCQLASIRTLCEKERTDTMRLEDLADISGLSTWSVDSIKVMLNHDPNVFLSTDKWIAARLADIYPAYKDEFKGKSTSVIHHTFSKLHTDSQKWTNITRFLWRLKPEGALKVRNGCSLTSCDFLPLNPTCNV